MIRKYFMSQANIPGKMSFSVLVLGSIGSVLAFSGLTSGTIVALLPAAGFFWWMRHSYRSNGVASTTGGVRADAYQAMCDLPYHNFADKTGIAIDPKQRLVHLVAGANYKVYGFDDIRKWTTNMSAGGFHHGGGLAAIAANAATARQNAESSGLFIEVRDIEFPLWKIRLPTNTVNKYEMELARWMEILRQHLSDGS